MRITNIPPIVTVHLPKRSLFQTVLDTIQRCWKKVCQYFTDLYKRMNEALKTPDISKDIEKTLPTLRRKIKKLTTQIDSIEQFVLHRPQLKKLCEKRWEKFAQYALETSTDRIKNLDMLDPIHQQFVLSLEIINKECILDNYKTFLRHNPDIEELVRRHIHERDTQEKTVGTESVLS